MIDENVMKKEIFYELVCANAKEDTLAFFIGSGFTKSIIESALNWNELINKVGDKLGVKLDSMDKNLSEPVRFSMIVDSISKTKCVSPEEAQLIVKNCICELTSYDSYNYRQNIYSNFFTAITPNCIVTTNYDTVIEKILCGKAISLSKENAFMKTRDTIPVYHIHGVNTDFKTIVATQRDYAEYLRPNNYALARLPFIFAEHFVVIIGYSIHDLNVLHAIDLAQQVYGITNNARIVQINYIRNGQTRDCLYNEGGIWILDTNSIESLFEDIMKYKEEKYNDVNSDEDILKIISCDENLVNEYINDSQKRNEINEKLTDEKEMRDAYYPYVHNFLTNVFTIVDRELSKAYNFIAYKYKLEIIIDFIKKIDLVKIPSLIFDYIIDQFDAVSRYIGNAFGNAWSATDYWNKVKFEIDNKKLQVIFERMNKINEENKYYISLKAINLIKDAMH